MSAALHIRHRAAVAVLGLWCDLSLDLEAQIRQLFLRALAEGLGLLGRVDRGEADLDLLLAARLAAACCEGVAVADADDEAEEGGRDHRRSPPFERRI